MSQNGYRAQYPSTVFQKAAVDASKMNVESVLTYPVHDLDGDYVNPIGGNFAEHATDPWVDLEHNGFPHGWARESLEDPSAPYSVVLKSLTIENKTHILPVGTTWFDPKDRIQAQTFAMIERDMLPGVSLEFTKSPLAEPRILKTVSPINGRKSLHFDVWECHRWTHCRQPVNPGAQTVTKAVTDALIVALQTKKVGDEAMHPTLFKSLSHYLPAAGKGAKKTTVTVPETKAMPVDADPTQQPPTDYDSPPDSSADADEAGQGDMDGGDEGGDEPKATPTAQSAYDFAQQIKDLCEQTLDAIKDGEHVQGKKALMKLCEKIDAIAEDAVGVGDKVAKDVAGKGDMKPDDEGGGGDGGGEGDEEEPDTEPDDEDDGVMKCMSAPHRKVYRKAIKRFTAREVQAAPTATTEPAPTQPAISAEERAALQKALKRLSRALNP